MTGQRLDGIKNALQGIGVAAALPLANIFLVAFGVKTMFKGIFGVLERPKSPGPGAVKGIGEFGKNLAKLAVKAPLNTPILPAAGNRTKPA